MRPNGTVLIIGGAEDKGVDNEKRKMNNEYEQFEILKELLPKESKKERIEIITTASTVPDEIEEMYRDAFKKMGFPDIGFMHIKNKLEARDAQLCERVKKAHAVFFSGGDQFRLAATLGGTDTIRTIRDRYQHDKGFVVAGTSAGAMAISKIMIYEGGVHEAILKDDLKVAAGFGILDNYIVDTHFIKRGRFGRLAHAVTMNPETLGIGLGEDTALIIKNGCIAECRGSGMVIIIDGSEILSTNITDITDSSPIFVENLKVHLLAKGCKFSIEQRKSVA
jgi:cyanophycinase